MSSNYPIRPASTKHHSTYVSVRWINWVVIPVLIGASILIGLLQIKAPSPVDSKAPLDQFSSARAMEKLHMIAKEPHPIETPAHDKVRDYLISELESLGLKPEIQMSHVSSAFSTENFNLSGNIENIITRIPGTDHSKAVMITAHYDTVRTGPGASDDGAAISAMLETARAVLATAPLKNDLILLMTDGEETGLLGAKAFVKEHPWVKDIGLVLNFEARGNKGPSFMFETSDQNGWLIQEFIKAAPQPIAYSFIYNIYKLMPNDTDMTMFREGGLAGLNFASGMGLDAYHQPIDTPENLDQSSLQHHGEYMLSLSQHFGNLDLNQIEQEDRVYFNIVGSTMVSYPQSLGIWLMTFGVLLFLITVWYGLRRRRLSLRGIMGGFFISLLSMVIVSGGITLLWDILRSNVSDKQYESILLNPHISIYYLLSVLFLTFLVVFVLVRWLSQYIRTENVWIGTLLLWLIMSVVTTVYLPGGSHLFIWPLLFSLIGLNLSLAMREGAWTWTSVLFAVPGFILLTPIGYLMYILLTLHSAGVLMAVVTLALSLIFPVICTIKKPKLGEWLA
ncbi:hypothetical protein J2T13_001715 [Paenibacillus sp. DS2015]|uniref:M28 family peptidase n=1 Tax=Paenibacillus sp. DS2015 TaxID=3373917 RepID=UPI003D225080